MIHRACNAVNMNTFSVSAPSTLKWDSVVAALRSWIEGTASMLLVDKSLIQLPGLHVFRLSIGSQSVDEDNASVRVSTVPRVYDLIAGLKSASPALDFESADNKTPLSIQLVLESHTRQIPLLSDMIDRQRAPPLSAIGGIESIKQSAMNHIHSVLAPHAVKTRQRLCIPAPGNDASCVDSPLSLIYISAYAAGFLIAGSTGCGKSNVVAVPLPTRFAISVLSTVFWPMAYTKFAI